MQVWHTEKEGVPGTHMGPYLSEAERSWLPDTPQPLLRKDLSYASVPLGTSSSTLTHTKVHQGVNPYVHNICISSLHMPSHILFY